MTTDLPRIWIDADACPKPVKEIVFRASERLSLPVILVANVPVPTPGSPLITFHRVEEGPDEADAWIADSAAPGDLVITADIPLAAQIVHRGAVGIDPRGDVYSEDTIGAKLASRNLLMDLRDQGVIEGGGPPPFTKKDRANFASAFDALLTKLLGPGKAGR